MAEQEQDIILMSQEGYDELVKKLEHEKTEHSDAVAEKLRVARGFGDLSENAEWDEAKREQASLAVTIAELEYKIKHAKVIDYAEGNNDTVGFGSVVRLVYVDNTVPGEQQKEYVAGTYTVTK